MSFLTYAPLKTRKRILEEALGEKGDEIVIRAQAQNLDEKAQMGIINKIKETLFFYQ